MSGLHLLCLVSARGLPISPVSQENCHTFGSRNRIVIAIVIVERWICCFCPIEFTLHVSREGFTFFCCSERSFKDNKMLFSSKY